MYLGLQLPCSDWLLFQSLYPLEPLGDGVMQVAVSTECTTVMVLSSTTVIITIIIIVICVSNNIIGRAVLAQSG
jgi:hypothetical protein